MLDVINFGKCEKCDKDAITQIADASLCPFHYIEQEDDECLKALLCQEIDEKGKINESKEVQLEIKKQKPDLYHSLEYYFDV